MMEIDVPPSCMTLLLTSGEYILHALGTLMNKKLKKNNNETDNNDNIYIMKGLYINHKLSACFEIRLC